VDQSVRYHIFFIYFSFSSILIFYSMSPRHVSVTSREAMPIVWRHFGVEELAESALAFRQQQPLLVPRPELLPSNWTATARKYNGGFGVTLSPDMPVCLRSVDDLPAGLPAQIQPGASVTILRQGEAIPDSVTIVYSVEDGTRESALAGLRHARLPVREEFAKPFVGSAVLSCPGEGRLGKVLSLEMVLTLSGTDTYRLQLSSSVDWIVTGPISREISSAQTLSFSLLPRRVGWLLLPVPQSLPGPLELQYNAPTSRKVLIAPPLVLLSSTVRGRSDYAEEDDDEPEMPSSPDPRLLRPSKYRN
jgi:hypothetical protein